MVFLEENLLRFYSIHFYVKIGPPLKLHTIPEDRDFNKILSTIQQNASTQISTFCGRSVSEKKILMDFILYIPI